MTRRDSTARSVITRRRRAMKRTGRAASHLSLDLVGGNNAQLHRGLAGEIAVDIADAVANDVIVGDDVRVFADDEAAA